MTYDTLSHVSSALADRSRVIREIGAGGMATVYLATDLRHGRDVAIKVLRGEVAGVLGGSWSVSLVWAERRGHTLVADTLRRASTQRTHGRLK